MEHAAKPPLTSLRILLRVFRLVVHPFAFLGAGLLSGLETAAAMITPILLQGFIRLASGSGSVALWESLMMSIALLSLIPLIAFGGRRCKRLARQGVCAMRIKSFRHILALPYEAFHQRSVGEYAALLTSDTERASAFMQGYTVGSLFRACLLLAASLGVLATQNPAMLALGLVMALLSWILPALLYPLEQRLRLSIQGKLDETGSQISQVCKGAAEIRSFGMQPQLVERYTRICRKICRLRIRVKLTDALINSLLDLFRLSAQPLALAAGAWAVAQGAMPLDTLVLASGYAGLLSEAAGSLSLFVHNSQLSLASAKRIFSLLDSAEESGTGSDNVCPGTQRVAIELDQVSFAYPNRPPLLENASLQVPQGQIYALTGESGGGKSTVFKLLLGFYRPTHGRIKLMGRSIESITLDTLREMTAYVSQDATLFQATLLDNIRWGRPEADASQVEEAARQAKIHDFIQTLPEGYDTVLSDGAQNISGGQRQRIALARAILKNAPILLLDEFTSALDAETEKAIISDLKEIFRGKTVLLIAHRPASLSVADRVIRLEKGKFYSSSAYASR